MHYVKGNKKKETISYYQQKLTMNLIYFFLFQEPHNLSYLNKAQRSKSHKIEQSPGLDCFFVLIP